MSGLKQTQSAQVPVGPQIPLGPAMSDSDAKTLEMVADAIAHKRVLLAYQPVMRSQAPRKVAFYECLIRVLDVTGRVIPAGEFMGAVENTDLGRQLDTLALAFGLRALHENPGLRLSINMSARSIENRRWNRTLDRWIRRDSMIAERLILEITESSALTAPDSVVEFMQRRQIEGISFALDDFGAGYTALSHFKEFRFDVLKIDGKFIQGIASDPDNQAMTVALISIARHFEMLVVAEFVETKEDAALLTRLGVDCLQGYYFAAPTTQPYWLDSPRQRNAS